MNIPHDIQEKIGRLQVMEQNIQSFHLQRQNISVQLAEIDHALQELGDTKEQVFKIIGQVMISSTAPELKKDLKSKKEALEVRVKSLENQESILREKAEALQRDVVQVMGQKEGKKDGSS
jgi:prefoldin beta subunit